MDAQNLEQGQQSKSEFPQGSLIASYQVIKNQVVRIQVPLAHVSAKTLFKLITS